MSLGDDLLAFAEAFQDLVIRTGMTAKRDDAAGDGIVTVQHEDRLLSEEPRRGDKK